MSTATLDTTTVRRWKRYPEYRPSGADWLPQVPGHWTAKRLKYLAAPSRRRLFEKPDDATYIGLEQIESKTGKLLLDNPVETVESNMGVFDRGDVLFGKLRPYLAKVAAPPFAGVCTTEVTVYRPRPEVSGDYLKYQLLSAEFIDFINTMAYGTKMPRVSEEQMGEAGLAVPPLSEQRAIAAFLDRETARIDALIGHKERLIALLEEKRQAVISHAVTRGLDPSAPFKDSGIPWLGMVPEHWELRRVNSFCRVVRGASPRPAGDPQYFNGDHTPWITVAEVTKDDQKYLTGTDSFLTAEGQALSRTLPVGTFVLTNSGATLGVPKILKISGCINDGSVAFYDLSQSVSKDFLYYFFRSQTEDLRIRMYQGMGQPNLNTNLVGGIIVPMPPPEEQVAIAARLDETVDRTRRLVETVRNGIARLQEYRTALISAAVTGQIDVRDEVTS